MEIDGCSNARVCVATADFVYKGEKNNADIDGGN